jgi:hypothetical protein
MASLVNIPGSLADPALRPEYIVRHREGNDPMLAAIPAKGSSGACAYIEDVTGVTCGHDRSCGCHARAQSEAQAGITDLLCHPWASPIITLHFVPGSSDWLASPTPTPDAWYEGSGHP